MVSHDSMQSHIFSDNKLVFCKIFFNNRGYKFEWIIDLKEYYVLITENHSCTCFLIVFLKQLSSLIFALQISELCKEKKEKMLAFSVSLGTSLTKALLAKRFNMLVMPLISNFRIYVIIVKCTEHSYSPLYSKPICFIQLTELHQKEL